MRVEEQEAGRVQTNTNERNGYYYLLALKA